MLFSVECADRQPECDEGEVQRATATLMESFWTVITPEEVAEPSAAPPDRSCMASARFVLSGKLRLLTRADAAGSLLDPCFFS